MRKVKVAAVQMAPSINLEESLDTAEKMIREAHLNGANIILLPELFERQYFCQERRYDYYQYAKETSSNDAVIMGLRLSKELGVVLLISFYELDGNNTYNTLSII